MKVSFVSVLLPLAIPKLYTYSVPKRLMDKVSFGKRVEVPLKNKLYSGLVIKLHEDIDVAYTPRDVLSVLDDEPIILPYQYQFWEWIAQYYLCHPGEVMQVALPGGFRLSSETKLVLHGNAPEDYSELGDEAYLLAEALHVRHEITIEDARDILGKKTVYPIIRSLLEKSFLVLKEELVTKYKPKIVGCVSINEYYKNDAHMVEAMEKISKSEHQTNALIACYQLSKSRETVFRSDVYKMANTTISALRALEKKGIVTLYDHEVSRLFQAEADQKIKPLSEAQMEAIKNMHKQLDSGLPILLHGVTGSGKTRIYIELIQEQLKNNHQTLYLLPEIALTTQLVDRLQHVFGKDVGVFHSRLNNHERVELWNEVKLGKKIVLGARSALFLPFINLGLIIVDEEHDPSYKQQDPNPRYNARDSAVYLARMLEIPIILGSATPSLESYYNALNHKYHFYHLPDRYGDAVLPDMQVIDLKKEYRANRMKGHFSTKLLESIEATIEKGEQVILFQNRRGFSPALQCSICGWRAECTNCDISLTYHKFFDELRCHYCGYRNKNPKECPQCGNPHLDESGVGTERIEEELKSLIPKARIKRMDYDTVRSKHAFVQIIESVNAHEVDVLIGTQMVTKGFDFDNITLIGIINADASLRFSDFRASERAFQLINQVAGRAGRKDKPGMVMIQAYSPEHPVILDSLIHNFQKHAQRELSERNRYRYPPIYRMIAIVCRHKDAQQVLHGAQWLVDELTRMVPSDIVQGPAQPGVARIKGYYIQNIILKFKNERKAVDYVKKAIQKSLQQLKKHALYKSLRVKIDVDPY